MATETTLVNYIEGAAASTPAASRVVTYAKADGLMYSKDDAGTETLMSAGGGGIPATIFDAKGDIIAASAADTAARLAVGANDLLLTAASGETTGLKWAYPVLTVLTNQLAADVDIDDGANVFVDGPAITLSVGTWLLVSSVTLNALAGAGGKFYCKLWDGTTVASSGQDHSDEGTGTGTSTVSLVGVAVIAAGTPTWKVSVASDGSSTSLNIKAAMVANGAGNNASTLVAVRIA